MTFTLAAILGYVAIQLVIGSLVARRVSSQADFLLAGRSLGPLLGTFTVFATWFGAETCLSSAGAAVTDGVSLTSVEPFGYGACLVLMGAVFAAPLARRGLTTLGDLFAQRFSPRVERLAAVIMVPSSALWAGAQIRGFGEVLASVSALDVSTAITLAASVVMLYTAMGGLLADAITDTLQGAVLIFGLLALAVAVVVSLGGLEATAERIDPSRVGLLLGDTAEHPLDLLETWTIPLCGSVLAQELVARALAMRTPELARRATIAGGGLYLLVGSIPLLLGLLAPALLGAEIAANPEQAIPELAGRYLGTALQVVFVGALVSAILSTVDSSLLAAASLTSQNLIASLRPSMSDRARLRTARTSVLAFGVLAWVLAVGAEDVGSLVEEASAFGSAGIFVSVCFGLAGHFGGAPAATMALLGGIASWIVGAHVLELDHPYLVSLTAATGAYALGAMVIRRTTGASP